MIQSGYSRPRLQPKHVNTSKVIERQCIPLNMRRDKQISTEGWLGAITGELVLDNCGHIIKCD